MLELTELKKLHDKAFNHNTNTRERAADDMLFANVTQYDDSILGASSLQYRGEFNVIRKATRQINADLTNAEVQVDFEPLDEERTDGADLLDGLYRATDRINTSIEAYNNASNEQVVCGVGAWELYTEYKSTRAGNEDQVIRRRPIYEANNNCFWEPNAKRLDKSDARYCSILESYSEDGYRDLVKDLTGEDIGDSVGESFKNPEHSYVFPWFQQKDKIVYVVRFYHIETIKDVVYTMTDPFGQTVVYRESELLKYMDDLQDAGYMIQSKKKIKRKQVRLYIASGDRIIDDFVVAGEHIPVIPCYGERMFVEGEEVYEGVVRLAKDPQRLRNFQLSYLSDIVSRSPRPKPIFYPEQVAGFEHMYEENGPDNNFPYLLQNRTTLNGQELMPGVAGVMPEQAIPQALVASIELSRQAVEDVANPGLPQDIADPDLSGKAVLALQARLDQQSMVYQTHKKHAKRRDAEIYASMAAEVYDAPRRVNMSLPDGTKKTVQIMEQILDPETGEMQVLNDLTNIEFEVYAEIGPSYATKKEETLEQLTQMAAAVAQTDQALHKSLIMKAATLIDGVAMDDVRKYARNQLLTSGFAEAENEEEEQLVAQAAQQQQSEPDPAMLIGMAEMKKSEADMLRAQNDQQKIQIEGGKLQQGGQKLMIEGLKTQSDIRNTDADTHKKIAEIQKLAVETDEKKLEMLIQDMPTEQLIELLGGG